MRWRTRFIFFILAVIIEIPLFMMGVEPVYIFISAFLIIFTGYTSWLLIKTKRLINLLEKHCDPLTFLEKYEKYKQISKRASFQNTCAVNISIGLLSLGRYDESLKLLQDIPQPIQGGKLLETAYYLALLDNYLSLGDLENAAVAYKGLKDVRKNIFSPRVAFAIDSGVAWYHYEVNKSPETARYYLMQLEYLCTAYSKKIGKRQKLMALYTRASLHDILGEHDEAAKKYTTISEHGNRLFIAKISQMKLIS